MAMVLGIDGGGTQTQACIVDETGRVLGMASAGPANFQSIGVEQATANVGEAERLARAAAGIGERRYDAVFIGLAGAGTEADRAAVLPFLRELNLTSPRTLRLDHDMRIALAGALAGRPGIVVIAGTGSAVFGMNEAGETARACGWGSAFDDPGSGYDLGRRAISELIAAQDGRAEMSAMSKAVALALRASAGSVGEGDGSPGVRAAVLSLGPTGVGRAKVGALAPVVIEAAVAGDAAARAVVREAVKGLAAGVKAVAGRLHFQVKSIEAAIVGGLARGGKGYLRPLHEAMLRAAPSVKVTPAELPPVLGAALLALRSIDANVGPRVVEAMKKSM